jgi:hypothetical protein
MVPRRDTTNKNRILAETSLSHFFNSVSSAFISTRRRQIAELAVRHRLPATYARPAYVEAGGLMTYGASITDLFRRAAT